MIQCMEKQTQSIGIAPGDRNRDDIVLFGLSSVLQLMKSKATEKFTGEISLPEAHELILSLGVLS